MKTLFALTTVAALMLGSSVAYAAPDRPDDQHGKPQGQPSAPTQSRPQAQPRPQAPARPQVQVRPQTQAGPRSQPRTQAQTAPQRQPHNQHSRVSGTTAPANNAIRAATAHGQAGGQAPGAHAKIDVRAYQRNVSATHQFHAGVYRAPQGYSYRRWSYGQSLPAIYFSQNFWLSNYDSYGLMAPPYGYVWVRFGPDALLIDEYSGEIVQVDYGMFY